jgi:hypothetical protein
MASKPVNTRPGQGRRTKAEQKRVRVEAARAALEREQRRQRSIRTGIIAAGAVVVIALAVVIFLVLGRPGRSGNPAAALPSAPVTSATGRDTSPPWAVPANISAAVRAAGLPMLGSEGTVEHIHVHLDVIVNGQPVTVPAGIGIDESARQISPLHTHDTTGVVHVESPAKASFSLGQFFSEWQVALSGTNLGGLTADGTHVLKAYVNGKPYTGNPAGIIFNAHDEIALVYGPATQQPSVPGSYAFPAGE